MRPALKRLLLLALETDALAERGDAVWVTRCLHCRAKLVFRIDGEPLGSGSLEHVVPKSWFDKAAAATLCAGLDSPDHARNLALACRSCNNQKGHGPDIKGPQNMRAYAVVAALRDKRIARWREPHSGTEQTLLEEKE